MTPLSGLVKAGTVGDTHFISQRKFEAYPLTNCQSAIMDSERPGVALTTPAMANTWIGGVDVAKSICAIEGCERPTLARGMCGRHYQRWYKKGDALAPTQDREVIHGDTVAAFWAKVDRSAGLFGCWLWTGATNTAGYGYINVGDNQMVPTHRFAYELLVGEILDGLYLDHVRERGCRSKACCNPAHLEPVTNQVNQQRAWTPDAVAERRAKAVLS